MAPVPTPEPAEATASRPVRRILVVKLSSLGDLFHALPTVHALRQGGAVQVDWVTQPEYAKLVDCFPDVDRVITFPRRQFFRSFRRFVWELRQDTYDQIFDFQGLFKSALAARLARGGPRVGPSFYREGARLLYDHVTGPRNKERHAVEEIWDAVVQAGLPAAEPVFNVRFPTVPVDGAHPRIAYLPCSRWTTKNWPPAYFAEVINAVHREIGGHAYLMGGPDDAPVAATIQQQIDPAVTVSNHCGRTDLVQLGGWLQAMDVVVTVDSGPMHMAAALGVPVVAIFGSTDPRRTGPYGTTHTVVQHGSLTCQPCRSRRCLRPEQDIACLRDLSPDRVTAAVLKKIEGLAKPPRSTRRSTLQ